MRLWLVRHGATQWSEEGRLCGWTDVPLSPKGRAQAVPIRRRLDGQRFDGAWTSDLTRAAEFARLTMRQADPDRRLRELDFGALEGKTWRQIELPTRESLLGFDGFAAPGGESVGQLGARVGEFLSELGEGDHLLFTHGGVIRLLSRRCGVASYPAPGELTVLEWGMIHAE
jgi:probable phosphoglycerate mutase